MTPAQPPEPTLSPAPAVTVLASRYVAGGAVEGVAVGSLAAALAKRWPSDAHAQQGFAPDSRRITSASPLPVTMTAVFFDVDGPAHRHAPEAEHAAWWAEGREKIERLRAQHPGFVAYTTAGGYRLVAQLREPVVLSTLEGVAMWPARYQLACDVLAEFEIIADRVCADVGHLFRLPYVVRDGVAQMPEVIGELADLVHGFELPTLAAERAEAVARRAMHTSRLAPALGRATAAHRGERTAPGERGDLFDRLAARGDVIRELRAGVWIVKCPNHAEHSIGYDGDGSTILYEANSLGSPGLLKCSHASCAKLTSARAWRRVIAKLDGESHAVAGLRPEVVMVQ